MGFRPTILLDIGFEDGRWLAQAIIGRSSTNNIFWVQTLKMGAGQRELSLGFGVSTNNIFGYRF